MRVGVVLTVSALLMYPTSAVAQSRRMRADALFGGWWIACDDQHTCAAVAEAEERNGWIHLARGTGTDESPTVRVGVFLEGTSPTQADVVVDGTMVARASGTRDSDTTLTTFSIIGADATALVDAVVRGEHLELRSDGTTLVAYSLAGTAAALRFADAAQSRADTPTALVARGTRPYAPPSIEREQIVVHAGRRVAGGRSLPVPPALLRNAAVRECLDYAGETNDRPEADRLGPNLVLYRVPCGSGAYNFSVRYFLGNSSATRLRSAGLDGDEGDIVTNSEFDARTGEITGFGRGRGYGDCGIADRWIWDGSRFRHVDHTVMAVCAGVPFELWPSLIHATIDTADAHQPGARVER